MDLSLSGLASNFDWKSLVDQLSEAERGPQVRLRSEQNTLNQRNNAYSSIKTQLLVLKNRVDALKEPGLFGSKNSSVTDSTVASASVTPDTPLGSIDLTISQLATAARHVGAINAGKAISDTSDVSGVVLSNAGFSTAVTSGTFTVNGHQVTLSTSDTLKDVFDKVLTATGGTVTGTYDNVADKITFTGTSQVVLGSATDTSNFIQVARLTNNGSNTVSSSGALGGVRRGASLATSNLGADVTDGGAGAGQFKINGVAINFNASTDSVDDILNRINSSTAGVTASYDSNNDRFTLTNQTAGDIGVALEDVTGNFLAATQLSSGSLARGQNLIYRVNGGDPLTSQSNTITESSSGIAGLSVTVSKVGATQVTVSSDTGKIRTAIQDFLTEYNKLQSMVEAQTAITTDAGGKVTAGLLSSETDVADIASSLRAFSYAPVSSLSTNLKSLDDIGIVSNGNDNSLKIEDDNALDEALSNQLSAVKALFTDSSVGLATKLDKYLEQTVGEEGTLLARQDRLTKDAASIDVQVSDMERVVQGNRERLTASFLAMEQAAARNNQQLQFLQQRFGSTATK